MLPLNLRPGERRREGGLTVDLADDRQSVWVSPGKRLELADSHAVAWIDRTFEAIRADGRRLLLGQFPAWVVKGTDKRAPRFAMFNFDQFRGGSIVIDGKGFDVPIA